MPNIIDSFHALGQKTYAGQAKWFINAYWGKTFEKSEENREHLFKAFKIICGLDGDGRKGHCVDQWKAHQFLEKTGGAITWEKFKKVFRRLDVDVDDHLSLLEYLVFKFDGDIKYLVTAPQKVLPGLPEAEAELEKCQALHEECAAAKAEAQKLHKQILEFKERFDAITAKLQKKVDTATSVVKSGKAKAELGAHLSGARARRKKITELDPEKLHTLEIKQGAAVRKQKRAARDAKKALKRAEKVVEQLRASGTAGQGIMWWLERELEDAKKSMSQAAFERRKTKLAAKKKKSMNATGKIRRRSQSAGSA